MAEEWTVSTGLSQDTVVTNLIEVGHPVFIAVTDYNTSKLSARFLGCSSNPSDSSKQGCMPTASIVGKITGHRASSDVTVTSIGKGVYLVKFAPRVTDDYCLTVCCSGKHIYGSPFNIKAIDKGSLNGHWSSSSCEPPEVPIGEPINLIIPDNILGTDDGPGRKFGVFICNSLGVCESSFSQQPHFKSIAVGFTPDIASSYFIKLTLEDHSAGEEISSKTFVVRADSADDGAVNCFVHSKDMHVFEKPHNFCDGPIRFRISTQTVTKNKHSNKLDVFCQGPGRALVKLSNKGSMPGTEICEVTPTAPGRYQVDIFWGGKPIRGNPFYVTFKPLRRRIGSSGLNLEMENFRIGVQHRFRINCSELGEGELKISCRPTSAADVSVKRLLNQQMEVYYQCLIIPRKVGQHEVWIKYDGHHLEGSPYKVNFKPRGDAAKCCMVSSPRFLEAGGNVSFQISTAGAGEGRLVGTAEEVNKRSHSRAVHPVEVKQISTDLYEIQFNPGTMSECLISVVYDNCHIFGSPFKMSFREVKQCKASGEGLVSAQAETWNHFTVSTLNAGPGALWVKIESSEGRSVDPIITRLTPSLLEVRYRPMEPGDYSISLHWGQAVIPGSPFQVKCSPSMKFVLEQLPPSQMPLGIPIKFKVHSTSDQRIILDDFSVTATDQLGKTIKGNVRLDENSEVNCFLSPHSTGNYEVSAVWRDNHIRGSPFNVTTLAPPRPENVHVHNLKRSVPVGKESSFWIDTSKAGPGLLSITVHAKNLQPFKTHSSGDPSNPGVVRSHFCPTHTGDYIIAMRWSGQHIPGSPFELSVVDDLLEEESVAVGVANHSHCCEENLQEGVTFL